MLLVLFLCGTHRANSKISMSCFLSAAEEGISEMNAQLNPETDQDQCDFPISRVK